jgi:transcriptional regulator with XRE-family HTH domain
VEMKQIIKMYREQKGITQEQLAKLINVTPQAIGNYESGIRSPDWATIKQIKRVLDIPASVVVGDIQKLDIEPLAVKNLFFSESDFLRFCSLWEWDEAAVDIDPNGLMKTNSGMQYRVFAETPFLFIWVHGQIIWEHPAWDKVFVEQFDRLLDSLKQKRLYERKTLFSVCYEDDYTHEIVSVDVDGYEHDTEEDIFVMAALKASIARESSLQECSDFRVVAAK